MSNSGDDPKKLREDLRRLQDRVDQLSRSVAQTRRHPYVIARQVFDSLLFYREFYASSQGYQDHLKDILGILRTWAQNEGDYGDGKFLMGLADLLEQANLGGPWPGTRT